jgi:TLC domain
MLNATTTMDGAPTAIVYDAAYYLNSTPTDDLDIVSRFMLRSISILLDDHGAWTWNLRQVAVASLVLLGTIRLLLQKRRGIDWYALIHAVISTVGSFVCLYLDYVASQRLGPGIGEPLRTIQCHGPLTSLHRILPAITMGYSIFDFFDGCRISFDFALHGGLTFAVMFYFVEINAPHILAPMLFMEGSTIFLNMINVDFFPNLLVILNQALFVLSFFLCRIVIVPIVWAHLMLAQWQNRQQAVYQECFPSHLMYVCFFFGMFYNLLNGYWFTKIVKKSIRRLRRIERHTEKNSLSESHEKEE